MILKINQIRGGSHNNAMPIIDTAKTTTASNMVIPKLRDSLT
jgi:hypothetical protein